MTLTLNLDPVQERELQTQAQNEGVSVDAYALSRLFPAEPAPAPQKRFHAMQFAGIAPTGRTAEEIDADIKAMRDEWDERESLWERTTAPANKMPSLSK